MASPRILWRSRLGADDVRSDDFDVDVELRVVTDLDAARDLVDWPTILVDGDPPEDLLDGDALERVIVPFAGVRDALRRAVAERPHLALHNSHFNAAFVAQHAAALLLAAANRLIPGHEGLRRGDWRPQYGGRLASLDLRDRRAVLLGYGAIGRRVRPMLEGFGLRVEAVRRRVPEAPDLPTHASDALVEALRGADVLIVSLPGTPATRGLVDAEALAALAPGAIVVNVGRGDVIDEWALYDALASGHLGGAGIDVWWRYPRDADARPHTFASTAPLHAIDNLVMSPHRANQVEAWELASVRDVAATVAAIVRGEARNRVDVEAGY